MKTILVDAADTLTIETPDGFIVDQILVELLDSYSNQKIVVTNADDSQIAEFGLSNIPYPLFTMKHSPNKPDPLFFETLIQKYSVPSNQLVYFEHNPDAVSSAESVGITTYHFNHEKRDLVALKEFLDKNLN